MQTNIGFSPGRHALFVLGSLRAMSPLPIIGSATIFTLD
jgi:hypothetical protein